MKKVFFIVIVLGLISCKKNNEQAKDDCLIYINDFIGSYSGDMTEEPGGWALYNTNISKSLKDSAKIVFFCFPNLCFNIEASVCKYNLIIPETTFYNLVATSHGGSVVEYYYNETISGNGKLSGNNISIDYNRKSIKQGATVFFGNINGHINISK